MRHAEVIDASLDVDGKFGSGIEFDTFEANESLAEMAQLSLLQNELKFSQANWTVSLWFESPIKIQSLTHKWVNIFSLMVMLTQALYLLKMKRMIHSLIMNPKGYLLTEVLRIEGTDFLLTLGPGWRNLVIRSSVENRILYRWSLPGRSKCSY